MLEIKRCLVKVTAVFISPCLINFLGKGVDFELFEICFCWDVTEPYVRFIPEYSSLYVFCIYLYLSVCVSAFICMLLVFFFVLVLLGGLGCHACDWTITGPAEWCHQWARPLILNCSRDRLYIFPGYLRCSSAYGGVQRHRKATTPSCSQLRWQHSGHSHRASSPEMARRGTVSVFRTGSAPMELGAGCKLRKRETEADWDEDH